MRARVVVSLVIASGVASCWLSIDESRLDPAPDSGAVLEDAGGLDVHAPEVDAAMDAAPPPATCAALVKAGEPKTTGIHRVTVGDGGIDVYCDMTGAEPLTLVYRVSADVEGDPLAILQGPPMEAPGEITPKATTSHYASSLLAHWNVDVPITEARTRIYDTDGNPAKEVVFDAKGSTAESFFDKSRLVKSPWSDTDSADPALFHASGSPTDKRRFLIHVTYNRCELDDGWQWVHATLATPVCDYEKPADKIRIFYAPADTATRWNVTKAEGSSFAIFVR